MRDRIYRWLTILNSGGMSLLDKRESGAHTRVMTHTKTKHFWERTEFDRNVTVEDGSLNAFRLSIGSESGSELASTDLHINQARRLAMSLLAACDAKEQS